MESLFRLQQVPSIPQLVQVEKTVRTSERRDDARSSKAYATASLTDAPACMISASSHCAETRQRAPLASRGSQWLFSVEQPGSGIFQATYCDSRMMPEKYEGESTAFSVVTHVIWTGSMRSTISVHLPKYQESTESLLMMKVGEALLGTFYGTWCHVSRDLCHLSGSLSTDFGAMECALEAGPQSPAPSMRNNFQLLQLMQHGPCGPQNPTGPSRAIAAEGLGIEPQCNDKGTEYKLRTYKTLVRQFDGMGDRPRKVHGRVGGQVKREIRANLAVTAAIRFCQLMPAPNIHILSDKD
ncbi:hypothetical protein CC79DRAFT_1320520 [Sarocladium strictum]